MILLENHFKFKITAKLSNNINVALTLTIVTIRVKSHFETQLSMFKLNKVHRSE